MNESFVRPGGFRRLTFLEVMTFGGRREGTGRTRLGRLLWLQWPSSVAIGFCGLLGVLLPAAYGTLTGIPEPRIHDEYCYLLAADTFARGRLSNPSPDLPEFFEAPHILVTPTYSAKYPPAQGLALALGSLVGGHPIWGVWLSCGLFAAALCWMLQAWTSRPWALATTLVAIATIGMTTYWAQSYFGGMVAASAGALLFGALRRTCRSARVVTSVLMALGVLILANSRPYEGLLACIPTGIVLAWWFVRDRRVALRSKITRWLVPFAAVLLIGMAWMLTYNRAVTGSWLRTPYSVHQDQYFHQGVFVFSAIRPPERTPVEHVARFYAWNETPPYRGVGLIVKIAQNFLILLPPAIETAFGLIRIDSGFGVLTPTVGDRDGDHRSALIWVIALLIACVRRRWAYFAVITTFVVLLGGAAVLWWQKHYSAPVVPLVLAVIAMTIQRVTQVSGLEPRRRRFAPAAVVGIAIILVVGPAWYPLVQRTFASQLTSQAANSDPVLARRVLQKSAVKSEIQRHPGNHLVFIHYEDAASSIRNDWVYNSADIPTSRLVFAHDLGPSRNAELIALFQERSVWKVSVSRQGAELERYSYQGAQ